MYAMPRCCWGRFSLISVYAQVFMIKSGMEICHGMAWHAYLDNSDLEPQVVCAFLYSTFHIY